MKRAEHRPLYARMLRLRHIAPTGLLCFVFLEGSIALGLLLALAELVSWWGVLVLPAMVALMVKLNDLIAGSLVRAAGPVRPASPRSASLRPAPSRPVPADAPVLRPAAAARPDGPASAARPDVVSLVADDATIRLPGVIEGDRGVPVKRPWAEKMETQQQWMRQAATRRYE